MRPRFPIRDSPLVEIGQASFARLVAIQFVDRAIALGSLAFTALVPLLLIAAAYIPGADGLASELIDRFHLTGPTAAAVDQLFAQPDDVQQAISWIGVLVLVGASLSFTRGLQRIYEAAWRLPSRGWRGSRAGLEWIGGIVLWTTVFASARTWLIDRTGPVGTLVVLLGGNALLWVWSPYVLLARRLPWRTLVPSGLVTSLAMTAYSIGSVVYMPGAIDQSASRYGSIGIAIALVSWLVGLGFALTASAGIGAVLGERYPRPA